MDAAALIREVRSRTGLTQAQLAARAGTSQPTLAAYEAGKKQPSLSTLNRIITASGMRLDLSLAISIADGALLEFLRRHRAGIEASADKHGVVNIRVFGSAATRTDTQTSDIDLLVDCDTNQRGLLPLVGFAQDVAALTDREVDAVTLDLLRDEIRAQVEVEAVPL